jgi:choline transport protein
MAIFGESKIPNAEEFDISSNGTTHDADRMHTGALGGTSHDASDMERMGKKQELRVIHVMCTDYATRETSD